MESPTARYVLPQFTERTSRGTRTLDPYSRLLEERIVLLGTEIDETSANDVIAQLVHLEHDAPGRDIALYINSPGGSLTAMTAVYDTMLFVGCAIETICLGQAAEEAAVLLAAGEPGRRLMLPGSRAVLRQPSLPEPVEGQVDDLEIRAREAGRARAVLEGMLVRHTGQSADRVAADIERDRIFTAGEAVAHGLADRIVENREGSAAATSRR
ncbi:ATP-dependent Clp protease proteolytic subunit [Streptomyces sp. F63]|uniref:ATP-dependent Clp protease proteolytic subunit n=1 Tax=Streptomyces sp. F63 TaxID=2824887 RepID=UPI001B37545B|nr:ATP-dependent Clp protease proteolytic subunit [Streptomyces sp. F63]MBQ0987418.1 ATP-dependent Clp protease proteolytic subunit [Streptomyces sp. F63]